MRKESLDFLKKLLATPSLGLEERSSGSAKLHGVFTDEIYKDVSSTTC